MHIVTHGLLSWLVAEAVPTDRRGRRAITLAGVIPDLDGLGAPIEVLSDGKLPWFSQYHHQLFHNGLTSVVVAALTWTWCRDWRVGLAALISGHLHLLCDLVGSRGPDGHTWPIPYLAPFGDWSWDWSGQWALNAWPNIVITLAALAAAGWLAARRRRSPLECVHLGLDRHLVGMLRRWMGLRDDPPAAAAEQRPPA